MLKEDAAFDIERYLSVENNSNGLVIMAFHHPVAIPILYTLCHWRETSQWRTLRWILICILCEFLAGCLEQCVELGKSMMLI